MDTLKGFVETVVTLLKLLIWTMLILYGFVGLWLLFHGNPKRNDEVDQKAYSFAMQAFFYIVVVFPLLFVISLNFIDNEVVLNDLLPPIFGFYLLGLFLSSVVGLINLLFTEHEREHS